MRNEVDDTLTPVSLEQLHELLQSGLTAFGMQLSEPAVKLLGAQLAIENARGAKVRQFNFGNLIATPQGWAGDFYRPPWFGDPGPNTSARNRELHEKMKAGLAPAAFRAYSSPQEGMKFYLEVAKRLGLTASAEAGVVPFAKKVISSGFCPDCTEAELVPALTQLQKEIGPQRHPVKSLLAVTGIGLLGLWWLFS